METPAAARPGPTIAPAVLGLALICCAVEAALLASDLGLAGSPRWRSLAYQNGAFWAGLLHGWRPNYPAQPWIMFLTYAFLHDGPWHVLGNMAALLWLGRSVAGRVGQRGIVLLWVASAAAGGLVFGLLSASPQPMVGASGALFGLAGAWTAWDWQERRDRGWLIAWLAGLAFLNLAFWLFDGGLLAWQAHLGGFVTGWLWATVPRHRAGGRISGRGGAL